MPEITDAEMREFHTYQAIGTPTWVKEKLSSFESDNHTQREEIRGMKEKLPKDGEVVVPKSDADKLVKYKELGKPDEIKGKLEAGATAQTNLTGAERKTAALAFVKAAGLAEETVDTLVAIPDLESAVFEVKKGKVKNKAGEEVDAEIPFITVVGADDTKETLDFAKALERFPALKGLRLAEQKGDAVSAVLPFVPQGSGEHAAVSGSIYDKIRADAKKKKEAAEADQSGAPVEARLGMSQT